MRAPDFWAAREAGQGALSGLLSGLLAPAGACYHLAGRLRRAAVTPARAACPVICVGNLVAGGAGKTPVVLSLVEHLRRAGGPQPHVLTRGYGGRVAGPLRVDAARHDAATVGDEPLLLAQAAPTWVARDRVAGAHAATAAGARLIVMDDGFQNPALAKDLSLLVVDGDYGLGNGRVIPAGPLRESPAQGLARADAVVLLGEERHGLALRLGAAHRLLRARLAATAEAQTLRGCRVLPFAGIGRPAKFFATLAELGAEVAETRGFPDHHLYRRSEIEGLLAAAECLAALPVTTAKDAVRLPPDLRDRIIVLRVEVAWQDPAALTRLLQPFLLSA
jgi:tetraacyldisaccharide 4'-kinase